MRLQVSGNYPDNWSDIAEKVKGEAGWRCIRCGHPDPREAVGRRGEAPCDALCTHSRHGKRRTLTVHHLTGNKADCRWFNLLALCQVCHLQIQAKVIPERPWLWDHSEWFKVYVAGFYAHYYGELDVTRAEAETRLEELLLLGQPWRVRA